MSGDISLGFDMNILDLGEQLWDKYDLTIWWVDVP